MDDVAKIRVNLCRYQLMHDLAAIINKIEKGNRKIREIRVHSSVPDNERQNILWQLKGLCDDVRLLH